MYLIFVTDVIYQKVLFCIFFNFFNSFLLFFCVLSCIFVSLFVNVICFLMKIKYNDKNIFRC